MIHPERGGDYIPDLEDFHHDQQPPAANSVVIAVKQGTVVTPTSSRTSWFSVDKGISEEEKAKRLEALQKVKKQNQKLIGVTEDVVFDPKVAEALKKYDTDGDGNLDIDEIAGIVHESNSRRKQVVWMRQLVAAFFVLLLVMVILNAVLTSWVIELSKDMKVSNDNSLKGKNDQMVKTEKPRYFTGILDIAKLPMSALNSLTRLSFTTDDGGVHNYNVQGVTMDAATPGLVYIYFTGDRTLRIANGTAVLRTENTFTGESSDANVLASESTPVEAARRLQAVQGYLYGSSMAYAYSSDLQQRCGITPGVCYHTFEEIQALHALSRPTAAAGSLWSHWEQEVESGLNGLSTMTQSDFARRLQMQSQSDSTVTYAEINADIAILSKDSKSGIENAQSLLEGVFGKYVLDKSNGTISVSFDMKEKCTLYATLEEDCMLTPLVRSSLSSNPDMDITPPFPGLYMEYFYWWFLDEVEYNKDPYTVQIKVRYAHDQKRQTRRHVVMMDRQRPSRVVIYDEVTIMYDPSDETLIMPTAKTYITNYEEEDIPEGDGLDPILSSSSSTNRHRRLSGQDDAEYLLMRHLREKKLLAFPMFTVTDDVLADDEETFRRRLSTNNPVTMQELEFSPVGTYGFIAVNSTNTTVNHTAASFSPFPEVSASDTMASRRRLSELFPLALSTAAVSSNNASVAVDDEGDGTDFDYPEDGVYAAVPLPANIEARVPSSWFSDPVVARKSGLIQWPKRSENRRIREYEVSEIALRGQLKALKESHRDEDYEAAITFPNGTTVSMGESRRRLMESGRYDEAFFRDIDHFRAKHRKRVDEISSAIDEITGQLNALVQEAENQQRRRLAAFTPASRKKRSTTDLRQKGETRKRLRMAANVYFKLRGDMNTNAQLMQMNADNTYSFSLRSGSECATLFAEWTNLYSYLLFYHDTMDELNRKAQQLIQFIDDAKSVESKLNMLINVNSGMGKVIPVARKIPYIGPPLNVMYNAFRTAVTSPITPAHRSLKNINNRIEAAKVKAKLEKFEKYTADMVEMTERVMVVYTDAVTIISVMDNYYPSCLPSVQLPNLNTYLSVTGQLCIDLRLPVVNLNLELDRLRAFFDELLFSLQRIVDFFSFMVNFNLSFNTGLFSRLEDIFRRIAGILSFRIHLSIPGICMYWARSCFRIYFPCWLGFCSRRICIPYPVFYTCRWYIGSFSIQDIIDVVSGIISQFLSILEDLVVSFIRSLGISIPSFSIPGLPSLDFLNDIFNLFGSIFDNFFFANFLNFNFTFYNPLANLLSLIDGIYLRLPKCN